jgi:hypothetical protein
MTESTSNALSNKVMALLIAAMILVFGLPMLWVGGLNLVDVIGTGSMPSGWEIGVLLIGALFAFAAGAIIWRVFVPRKPVS